MDRHPKWRGVGGRKLKSARKNTDDGGWFTVQMDDAPNDLRIGAKFGAPEAIGENRHVRAIGLHFLLLEITSQCRRHAESLEKIGRHLRGESVLGLAVGGKRESVPAVGGERLHAPCRVLPIQIVRVGYVCADRAGVRLAARLAEMEEPSGLAIRQ